jgi:hypothetical protein
LDLYFTGKRKKGKNSKKKKKKREEKEKENVKILFHNLGRKLQMDLYQVLN